MACSPTFYAHVVSGRQTTLSFLDPRVLFMIACFCFFTGKAKTKEARQTIINPDWNFEKMGIGGLDREFSDIFRRAFASRVFPPDIVEQMGEKPPYLHLCCHFIFLSGLCSFMSRFMRVFGLYYCISFLIYWF